MQQDYLTFRLVWELMELLIQDNLNIRIGIGTTNPQSTLKVGVAITMDGGIGVITATTFSGNATSATSATSATTATNAEGLTGTPDITVRNVTGVAATFTGVLTYEDVTNVDSVGIVTARAGSMLLVVAQQLLEYQHFMIL